LRLLLECHPQQIYRTLRTMEDDGWVHVTPVAQQGRPDKKVYTLSAAGRAELARWIAEPLTGRASAVTDDRTRDLAVKLHGAALLDTCLGFEKRPFPDPSALSGSALHQYLVLRGGIRAEESSVD
jgi:Transcriptional regulator PadR-like family